MMINRSHLLFVLAGLALVNGCGDGYSRANGPRQISEPEPTLPQTDHAFLSMLSAAGIFDAAESIGLDAEVYLVPLAASTHHAYARYRWSVGHHEDGGVMISALPPEEEVGWTPWERWYRGKDGSTRKESWVLYPLRNATGGMPRWYRLDEQGVAPRYLRKPSDLKDQLRLARIDEAADVLGFDAEEVLVRPLSSSAQAYYQKCRWVVVPHILAADGPVIYILPPMNKADEWPWESWYTDGRVKLIHHVHYTKKTNRTTGAWKEYTAAPQRPPEIFGVEWFWYDDKVLRPTMADY